MAKVEANAAKLSEAAVPKILEKLDSASFRTYLADCCPSVANLSADELLAKLDRHIQAAEVASGFPAIIAPWQALGKPLASLQHFVWPQDPAQMYPDSAGMSVDYGLDGSFFLPGDLGRITEPCLRNDWQAAARSHQS